MPTPTREQLSERFAVGLCLDHLWCETMGLPLDDKKRTLTEIVAVLRAAGTPYAVIGGVALQLYSEEPRTTIDVDIAVSSRDRIPREQLRAAGFAFEKTYRWTENWRGPAGPGEVGVAVQFSEHAGPVERAVHKRVADIDLALVTLPDLVELKLQAAEEAERRPSKRRQDVVDVMKLLDEHPELDTPEVRARVDRAFAKAATAGRH